MLNSEWLKLRCGDLALNKTVWIAYSGGVDSHVLLHLASKTFANLHAVHIHHGLSKNADMWAEHCQNICAQSRVALTCIKVNAKPKNNQSPEDAARIARRRAWAELLDANDLLLVAQHAEDQAETILYRMLRGTGPHGLGGMAEKSSVGDTTIFRPMLNISKQDILNYAQQNNLDWITDESNSNTRYDRNFIRQNIMPLLQARWPRATQNINRAGKLSAQLCANLEPLVQEKLEKVFNLTENFIDLDIFKNYDFVWQIEVLRAWLQINNLKCSHKRLEIILQQVIAARYDANPELIIENKILRRSKQKLYCLAADYSQAIERQKFSQFCYIDNDLALNLPNGKTLTKNNIDMPESIARKLQDHMVNIRFGSHGKKAKKIFQQYGIPAWRRNEFPLIFLESRLIGIAGLWWSSRFGNGG